MDKNIIDPIRACVAESLMLDVAEVKPDSNLKIDLKADSLDFMDIIFGLEKTFNISLEKEDFNLIALVGLDSAGAVKDNIVSGEVKAKLKQWMQGLPLDEEIHVNQLWNYVTVSTMAVIVQQRVKKAA